MNYFDYEAKEVEEATNNMMNVLSNNICVEFDEFKKLFYLSMTDIVELASNPKGFLKKDFLSSKFYKVFRFMIFWINIFSDIINIYISTLSRK